MDGVELSSNVLNLGYVLYNLKIYKETFLENNNKFMCKYYDGFNEYSQVFIRFRT